MEFLGTIAEKICDHTVLLVANQWSYLHRYRENVDKVKVQIQHLNDAKERVQHSVDEARRNGNEIEADVRNWLARVTSLIEKTDDFLEHEDLESSLCSSKFFMAFVSRHKLSKKAESLAKDAVDAIKQAKGFQKVYYRVTPKSVVQSGGYMAFQSRISIFNEIMEALRNRNVRMIGMYGMPGVGKTMLVKEVARQAEEDKLFNKVVMVTVSQTADHKKIQKETAEQLELELKKDNINLRAKRLRQRLEGEKKILLVLDDIWEKFELEEIGIAFGNDQNDCKILITSRNQDVVYKEMGSNTFMIEGLDGDESKNMFYKIVGDPIESADIQTLATDIIKECGGLPIAIATVANALRNKSYPIWNNALQELRRSIPTNIRGMFGKVYSSIKLSYNFLESSDAKSMLLALSLFPEDAVFEVGGLLTFGMGLRLFEGMTNLEDARNKVLALVDNLKSSCLLLDAGFEGGVRLHDVIRDFLIVIGSEERHMYCIKNVIELEDKKELKVATAISMPDVNDASQLPERLECPQLELFHMKYNNQSLWENKYFPISNHFFEEMKHLRVLILSSLCLKPLPSSFIFLEILQALHLINCEVGDMALIGELKTLKILGISASNIKELPKQIGQLTRLQVLTLSNCSKLELIEYGVISSLIHLEELFMEESFTNWDVDRGNCEKRNASLIELKNLCQLTTLQLHILDVNIIPKDLFCLNLKRYNILIGPQRSSFYEMSANYILSSRVLQLDLDTSGLWEFHGLEMMLRSSEVLTLHRSTGINKFFLEMGEEGFPLLKRLMIANNDGMQYIFSSMEKDHACGAFPSLEILCLQKLANLEKICRGQLSSNCFARLKTVRVRDCDKLENLFSFSIAKVLEEIDVTNCKMIREIVSCEREDDLHPVATEDVVEFPRLRSLRLGSSLKLIHFFCPELEIDVHMKDKPLDEDCVVPLFNRMVTCPSLKYLDLSTLNSKMLWPDEPPESFNMQNLTTLMVNSCNSLKYLLSFAMARSLVQLEYIEIHDCSSMGELLAINDNIERMDKKLLPNLKVLVLQNLPNFKRFCSRSQLRFPSLVELRIDKCPTLEDEVLIGELSNLEVLLLSRLNFVELPREVERLTRLRLLDLRDCPKLEMIKPNIISGLKSLEGLNIVNSFTKWEAEGIIGERSNACLSELKNLAHLKCLSLAIPDVNILPKCWFSYCCIKLERFYITIGDYQSMVGDFRILKRLDLKLNKSSLVYDHDLRILMKRSEELTITGIEDVNSVVYDPDGEGFPQLQFLRIQNNVGVQCIIDSTEESRPGGAFVSLKSLFLQKLMNLEKLCQGKLTEKCFGKLRFVAVRNCDRLKSLFSTSEARILSKVKYISLVECNMMEEMVIQDVSTTAADKIEFSELRSLKLQSLPKFNQVYSETKTNNIHQRMAEQLVANFVIPFNGKVKFPMLKVLTLVRMVSLNAIWNCEHVGLLDDDQEHPGIHSRLEVLNLSELPHLVHLWEENYHPGRAFQNLKSVWVERCDKLSNLVPFQISFQNLRTLTVSQCNGMASLLTSSTAKSLTQLRSMHISRCNGMIQIMTDHKGSDETGGKVIFYHLQALELRDLPILASFYSGNYELSFPELKWLVVDCPHMQSFCKADISIPKLEKVIVKMEEIEEDGERVDHDIDDYYYYTDWDDDMAWNVYPMYWLPYEEMYNNCQMQQLVEGDINSTIRQISQRDQDQSKRKVFDVGFI